MIVFKRIHSKIRTAQTQGRSVLSVQSDPESMLLAEERYDTCSRGKKKTQKSKVIHNYGKV